MRHVQGGAGNTSTQHGPAGGTPGGRAAVGSRPGSRITPLGNELYLWALVALEVLAIGWLRSAFRRHHGG